VKSISGVVSAIRVHVSGWDGGKCGSKLRTEATGFLSDS